MKKTISALDKWQLKTLSILRKLPKNDLIHLTQSQYLSEIIYDNHNRRAAAMLIKLYSDRGLSPVTRAKVDSYFT